MLEQEPLNRITTMFSDVLGQKQLSETLNELGEASYRGEAIPLAMFNGFLVRAKPVEKRQILTKFLSQPPSAGGILASYLAIQHTGEASLHATATAYAIECIEHDSELEAMLYRIFAEIDKPPLKLIPYVSKAIQSSSDIRSIAAAGLASELDCEELRIEAVRRLMPIAMGDNSAESLMATTALSGFAVRMNEIAPRIIKALEISVDLHASSILNRLNEAYRKIPELITYIRRELGHSTRSRLLLASVYQNLGRICFDCEETNKWLVTRLKDSAVSQIDEQLALGIGLGLTNQQLTFPRAATKAFLALLDSPCDEVRIAAAMILNKNSSNLFSDDFITIGKRILIENDQATSEQLTRVFVGANAKAIPVAAQLTATVPVVLKPTWMGICGELFEKHPDRFLLYYKRHRTPELSEVMPAILANAALSGFRVVKSLREALSSENELERYNALTALERSGPGVAELSPFLVDLFLRGNDQEKTMSLKVLLRMKESCHPYLRDYNRFECPNELAEFQRLQRITAVGEADIKHIEVARLGNIELVRYFIEIAQVFSDHGKLGMRGVADIISAKRREVKRQSVSEQHVRRTINHFESEVNRSCDGEQTIHLFDRVPRQPSELNDEGTKWLIKCREYLAILDKKQVAE